MLAKTVVSFLCAFVPPLLPLLNQNLSLFLPGGFWFGFVLFFFFPKQKRFLLTLALKSVCRLHQNSSVSCIL